jgi:hypothetical protein
VIGGMPLGLIVAIVGIFLGIIIDLVIGRFVIVVTSYSIIVIPIVWVSFCWFSRHKSNYSS